MRSGKENMSIEQKGFIQFDNRAEGIRTGVIAPIIPVFPEAETVPESNSSSVSKNGSNGHKASYSEGRLQLPPFERKKQDARVQRRSDVENEFDRRRPRK